MPPDLALLNSRSLFRHPSKIVRETPGKKSASIPQKDASLFKASFKAVVLEGLEVVFIVIAVGAGRGLIGAASLGALAACLIVIAAGFVLHRPLARVPENTLKFAVGTLLSSFGIFWTGEGLGVPWPGEDLAIVAFAALFLTTALLAIVLARRLRLERYLS